MASPTYNDSNVPYGARVLSITNPSGSPINYVCEQISVDRPVTIIERFDELGAPNGQVGVPKFVTGSATLQLATSLTVVPLAGATFSTTFAVAGSPENCVIHQVTQPENQMSAKTLSITFRKLGYPQ